MPLYHVSLGFAKLPDPALDEFTGGVLISMDSNPAYPTPAVSLDDLLAAQQAFEQAMAAMTQGGKQATADKNVKRAALVALLRQEAIYVQGAANNDLPTLLSSGFLVNSTSRTKTPLTTPNILEIDNGMTTQLVVRAQAVTNARAYEAQVKNGTGGWVPSGTFTQARRIVLGGLTPGSTYTVQVRGVGGSLGYSDWSDPVSHMVM
jgi:hypothetical protein